MQRSNGYKKKEKALLYSSLFVNFPVNPLFDLLPYPWYGRENSRRDFLHIVEKHLADGFRVGEGSRREDSCVIDSSLEGMPDRQYRNEQISLADVQWRQGSPDLMHVVAMAQHDSLWLAGGSGSVDNRCQIGWLAFVDAAVEAVGILLELLLAQRENLAESK